MNSNKFNYLNTYWKKWNLVERVKDEPYNQEINKTYENNIPAECCLDFHYNNIGNGFKKHLLSVLCKANSAIEFQNEELKKREQEIIMERKWYCLIHLRGFIYSAGEGYVNKYTINNGKTHNSKYYSPGTNPALIKYYRNELGKSFEWNIKKNFKKACNKYYKIIYYLQQKNIFHENRKHIIQYIFGEEYYSSFIQMFIWKYSGTKKIYNYFLRMNPKETLEFGNVFLNNLNKGTKKHRYYKEQTFSKYNGSAFELTQFKFKTITERSLKRLEYFMNPMELINAKKKEQETNPIGVGAVRAGLEFFNNNYESKKKVKFSNESEAVEFKHNKAKRAEFIYRMFKKYKPLLNKEVECYSWNEADGGGIFHKGLIIKKIRNFKKVFTTENRSYGSATKGIQLPNWSYNYVPNPNAVNKYIEYYIENKKTIKITKFKNKEEEKKFKHIEGNNIVIEIPKVKGWREQFNNIIFKKNKEGEPIVEYWWENGKKHRNSLKAKKLN